MISASTIILHCDTWSLLPPRIRIKAFLGILSEKDMQEYGIHKRERGGD